MNKFKYTLDNKRYHTFNYYLKTKYQNKVAKIPLNADFTCPNLDGTKAYGGCIYCSSMGSGDFAGDINDDLTVQFEKMVPVFNRKWPGCKYIAYFQANSNTYGPVAKVAAMVQPFLAREDVVAISLATRPDCLKDEMIEYLAKLAQEKDLWVELGLQTIHDQTGKLINRGHSFAEFESALAKLCAHDINVCVHIINSLPYETREMMLETARTIGKMDIQALKIHMLFVIENTALATMYNRGDFELLSRDEYIEIVSEQLALIDEKIVIERLTGDGNPEDLIAPMWSLRKVTILNDIDKYMKEHDLYQGSKKEL